MRRLGRWGCILLVKKVWGGLGDLDWIGRSWVGGWVWCWMGVLGDGGLNGADNGVPSPFAATTRIENNSEIKVDYTTRGKAFGSCLRKHCLAHGCYW